MAEGPVTGTPQEPQHPKDAAGLSNDQLETWIRWAIYQKATQAATIETPKEFAELGEGILKLVQSVVILDPSVVAPQGVPPDALHPPTPRVPMDKSAPSAVHNAGG